MKHGCGSIFAILLVFTVYKYYSFVGYYQNENRHFLRTKLGRFTEPHGRQLAPHGLQLTDRNHCGRGRGWALTDLIDRCAHGSAAFDGAALNGHLTLLLPLLPLQQCGGGGGGGGGKGWLVGVGGQRWRCNGVGWRFCRQVVLDGDWDRDGPSNRIRHIGSLRDAAAKILVFTPTILPCHLPTPPAPRLNYS